MSKHFVREPGRLRQTLMSLLLLPVMLPALWSCTGKDYSRQEKTVIIGQTPHEANALFYIAESQGFFAVNGIKIVFKDYVSGAAAAEGMVTGEVDLATCAEFVAVGKILQKKISALLPVSLNLRMSILSFEPTKGSGTLPISRGKGSVFPGGPLLNSIWAGLWSFKD